MVFAKEKRAKSLCVATEWLVRFRRPTPSFRSCASQSPWVFPHWSQDCFPGSTLPQSSTFRCNHQEQNCMYPLSICNSLDPATSIRNHPKFNLKSQGSFGFQNEILRMCAKSVQLSTEFKIWLRMLQKVGKTWKVKMSAVLETQNGRE